MNKEELKKLERNIENFIQFMDALDDGFINVSHINKGIPKEILSIEETALVLIKSHLHDKDRLEKAEELIDEFVKSSLKPHGILRVMVCKYCDAMYDNEHADGCPVREAQSFLQEEK